MHYLIDVFAILGAICFACMIGLSLIWAFGELLEKYQITHQITRPLPAEPFQATAEIKEVH